MACHAKDIASRTSLTNEEWVNWHAAEDEDWYKAIEQDFGLNARPRVTHK